MKCVHNSLHAVCVCVCVCRLWDCDAEFRIPNLLPEHPGAYMCVHACTYVCAHDDEHAVPGFVNDVCTGVCTFVLLFSILCTMRLSVSVCLCVWGLYLMYGCVYACVCVCVWDCGVHATSHLSRLCACVYHAGIIKIFHSRSVRLAQSRPCITVFFVCGSSQCAFCLRCRIHSPMYVRVTGFRVPPIFAGGCHSSPTGASITPASRQRRSPWL